MPYTDPEKRKEYNKQYYYNNKEKENQRSKLRHQQHKEEDNKKSREYHKQHKDEQNTIRRDYHKNHHERHLQTCQKWYNKNKDHDNKKSREYQEKHRDIILPKLRQNTKNRRYQAMTILSKGTPKCIYCECDYFPFLEINHINGGGSQERKSDLAKGSHLADNIVNGNRKTDDLEVCCRVCNALHYLKMKDIEMAKHFTVVWVSESNCPLNQSPHVETPLLPQLDQARQA
jgi:hypothetical protein